MTARVLVIDNYDSFTYNLVQALRMLGAEVRVHRNDAITTEQVASAEPTHLVVSPGPGRPEAAGCAVDVVRWSIPRMPVLGVCLGHQAIAAALGGSIESAPRLMHGKASLVYHDGKTLYEGLPNPFSAGRYHSLAVSERDLPGEFGVSAYTSDGEIMGIRHRDLPTEGVQFHPESVLTPEGNRLLGNFLDLRQPAAVS